MAVGVSPARPTVPLPHALCRTTRRGWCSAVQGFVFFGVYTHVFYAPCHPTAVVTKDGD